MKIFKYSILLVLSFFLFIRCGGGGEEKIQVTFHDIPFPTEKNLRIGYTLSTWEYEKDGLELQKIVVLDNTTKEELMVIGPESLKNNFPVIYKNPITPNPYFTWDTITRYYLSLQLSVPLEKTPPSAVTHRFVFLDTGTKKEVTIEGGTFSPRFSEAPVVIASPIKRKNLIFVNQSTIGYHFYVILFLRDTFIYPERYAFDSMQYNDELTATFDGDPEDNTAYFNYGSPLYAVADGTVISVQDGLPENHGNAQDVTFNSAIEYAGNFLVLDIGNGRYAYYCHAVPGSIKVKPGDTVKEGDELALLGNSGNSTAPHLHFHVCDGPDFFSCNGIPIVLKTYTKTGDAETGTILPTPLTITSAMMEESTVFTVE